MYFDESKEQRLFDTESFVNLIFLLLCFSHVRLDRLSGRRLQRQLLGGMYRSPVCVSLLAVCVCDAHVSPSVRWATTSGR